MLIRYLYNHTQVKILARKREMRIDRRAICEIPPIRTNFSPIAQFGVDVILA